jgi:hypothetical protein
MNNRGYGVVIILAFIVIGIGAAWIEYIAPCDWWDGEPVSGKPERCIK